MRKNAQKAPDSDERGANGKEQGKEPKSAANQRKGGKVSVYCERFAGMLTSYASTQNDFARKTGMTGYTITNMKKNTSMLMIHLPDIARGIPDFNFHYLFYGRNGDIDEARKLIARALSLL